MRHVAVAALLAALPVEANAQVVRGPYVSAGGGVNLQQNELVNAPLGIAYDFNDILPYNPSHLPSAGVPYKYAFTFSPGVSAQVSAGYGFGNGVRVEIEGDFLSNHVSGVAGALFPAQGSGYEQKLGGMVNVLYDFDFGLPVFPYLGVGVGGQVVAQHDINAAYSGAYPPEQPVGNISNLNHYGQTSGFAYQGIAGFALPLAFVPGLSLTTEYRFLGLADPLPDISGDALETVATRCKPPVFCIGPRTYRYAIERRFSNNFNHALMLGVRYAFGAPPPVPPPQAASAPIGAPELARTRTYLVFFDWDRADLSARARAIVAEAAQASTRVQTTRIAINGYTDLSGTAAYNQRLSVRRAQAVRAELVRDGVADGEISIHGYGESNPLVPTAPGVREPQNRRVEIILS